MADLISIDAELTRLVSALRVAVAGYEKWAKEAADRKTDREVAWAKAMLGNTDQDQTIKIREAQATLVIENVLREARIAEANREAFKVRGRAIETTISVQQSRLRRLEETEPSGY